MRPFLALVFAVACVAATSEDQQFNGRWDITVKGNNGSQGWWLEVSGAGTGNVKGKFVGAPGGSMDDIPKLSIYDSELRFALDKHYRRDRNAAPKALQKGLYYARLDNGMLKGTFEIEGDPTSYLEWTGVRAPVISEKDDASWKRGEPQVLFDGKSLAGWSPMAPGRPLWSVKQGILTNAPGSSNLITDKKFWNFALHVEYRIGPAGNSGIGLRGRYEVQIVDDIGRPPTVHGNGSIFDRIAPVINASKEPGEWQTFDIRLVGRQVTVILNGVRVIDRQVIEGITPIAMDANEAEPGPILLQGDHGLAEFRRIVLYPLTKAP